MIVLRSIINIFDKAFLNAQTQPIFDQLHEKEKKAFFIIKENQLDEDIQIKEKILSQVYNTNRSSSTYRSFISTLENKFIWIASLCIYNGTELENIRSNIEKEYLAFINLGNMGLYDSCIKLGLRLYKKAIKYEAYPTARNIVEYLEMQLSVFGTKEQEVLREQLKSDWQDIDLKCKQNRECAYKFGEVLRLTEDMNAPIKQIEGLRKWADNISDSINDMSSKCNYFYYQIRLKLHTGEEYEKWCREALNYFENLFFYHERAINIFRGRLLKYRFENGDTSISTIGILVQLRNSTKLYSTDWFSFSHSLVKVYLNINDIIEAGKIIEKVFASSRIKYISHQHRNAWKIIRMYWNLTQGKFDEVNIRKIKQSLNYKSKEKSHENIPFLIGEVLYFLKTGELDQDRRINHLRKMFEQKCSGNDLKRGLEFCNALQNGTRFSASKSKTSFTTEYVFYENLLSKVAI
tara:strand:+ start:11495 stop:12883 length:1389 start_codon:yes stop_codon:yes gene_type:complete